MVQQYPKTSFGFTGDLLVQNWAPLLIWQKLKHGGQTIGSGLEKHTVPLENSASCLFRCCFRCRGGTLKARRPPIRYLPTAKEVRPASLGPNLQGISIEKGTLL